MRESMPRVVQRVGKVVDVSRREVLIVFLCFSAASLSLGALDGSVGAADEVICRRCSSML